MLREIASLAAESQLLIVVFVFGAFLGAAVERLRASVRRRRWRKNNPWSSERVTAPQTTPPSGEAPTDGRADAADQLRIVMSADFSIQPLLNKGEARVFRELDRYVLEQNANWQVMAQVSLGEILRSRDSRAYACINSKRVDLLIVDESCRPRHVVEYQGEGHHQGTAAARDAIKKEALRRAGIPYHEVVAGHTTPMDLRRLVQRLVIAPAVEMPTEGLDRGQCP